MKNERRFDEAPFELGRVGGLSVQLQEIIENLCSDENTIEKVMTLCEHKYHHLVKTSSLI